MKSINNASGLSTSSFSYLILPYSSIIKLRLTQRHSEPAFCTILAVKVQLSIFFLGVCVCVCFFLISLLLMNSNYSCIHDGGHSLLLYFIHLAVMHQLFSAHSSNTGWWWRGAHFCVCWPHFIIFGVVAFCHREPKNSKMDFWWRSIKIL